MKAGASNQQDWIKLVTISHPDIYFSETPDAEGRSTSSIELFNRSNQNMIFKIKTTNPGKFIVKPNVGQLTPESSTTISILFFGNAATDT